MLSRLTLVSFLFLAQTGPLLPGAPGKLHQRETRRHCLHPFCARCHRAATRVATDFDPTDGQAVATLDGFLATHHAGDATIRADIIAFLANR